MRIRQRGSADGRRGARARESRHVDEHEISRNPLKLPGTGAGFRREVIIVTLERVVLDIRDEDARAKAPTLHGKSAYRP